MYSVFGSLWNGVARSCVDIMARFCVLCCERMAETTGCAYDKNVSHSVQLQSFICLGIVMAAIGIKVG